VADGHLPKKTSSCAYAHAHHLTPDRKPHRLRSLSLPWLLLEMRAFFFAQRRPDFSRGVMVFEK
jgi:hypothetical protein